MSQERTSTKLIVASAPGRCGIIGNPSDIYGGRVVSCSTAARARCRLHTGEVGPAPEDARLLYAALRAFPISGDFWVEWSTEIPRSSGLSGSTALLASTMLCLAVACGKAPDLTSVEGRANFAELVRHTERWYADIMCGYQDAYMIVNGGMQAMDFAGKSPVQDTAESSQPAAVCEAITSAADLSEQFLLVTTGVERLSGSVHAPLAERWLEGEHLVRQSVARLSELGQEGQECLRRRQLEKLGRLMNESHEIVRSIGGTGPEVDRLADACLECGAYGAKLAGAGMGGTIIAVTADTQALSDRLRDRGFSRFLHLSPQTGLRIEGDCELS